VLKRFRYQIAIFLSVVGPGLITANVDNDSGGILTYSQAAQNTATCRCGH